jgi:hypothetical protein
MSPRSEMRRTSTTGDTTTRFVATLLFIVIALSIACTQTARFVYFGQLEIWSSKI